MPKLLDLTGQSFGRWTALYVSMRRNGKVYWWCRCDCGNEQAILANSLTRGKSLSCGCLRNERVREACVTHDGSGSIEYHSWTTMISRCTDPEWPQYEDYGGRGITVCPEWFDFQNFIKDVGLRPSVDYTLDRKDNSRGYEPGNVRWATREEQARNRRSNVWVKAGDRMLIIKDALPDLREFNSYRHYRRTMSAQAAYDKVIQRRNRNATIV